MAASPEFERLRAIFAQPGFQWILERLIARMAGGRALTGVLTHTSATPEERRAVDDLLGRRSTVGTSLTLELAALEHTLRAAGLIERLEDVVLACHGPVVNRREESAKQRAAWQAIFEAARERCVNSPALAVWLDDLAADGTLKRFAGGSPPAAARLLDLALRILTRDPQQDVLLANLASSIAGDSHALDRGAPLGTLCLRGIAALHGIDGQAGPVARRDAWSAIGVIVDDLSAPALVFNLHAVPGTPLEELLGLHRRQVQPAFLTHRQMRAPSFEPLPSAMKVIFVCENPSVVSAAALELGPECAPLICTNGQPTSTVRLLLARLCSAGAELRCHADFDWAGLQIVDQLVRTLGAVPWRMAAQNYLAVAGTVPLAAREAAPGWAPDLWEALRSRRKAVYEEQVLPALLADLRLKTGL